jgi:hypothetical protein
MSEHAPSSIGAGSLALRGLVAGLTGVAAMTATEKIEQLFTGRPNSFVPAHTLQRISRPGARQDEDNLPNNWAMHWGQGIALGTLRTLMASKGVRGPMGSFIFMNVRLLNDQALENATGAGAPPWTWPVDEQAIDLFHKGVYAFVAGYVADRLVGGPPGVPAERRPWLERPQPAES